MGPRKIIPPLFLLLLVPQAAFAAQPEGGATLGERLASLGRLALYFLLVMGMIFGVLLLTKKIAAWVDRQREKRKENP